MSVLALTKDNFRKEALESKDTVLIDFWATWCGPCRMLSPVVDEIAGEAHQGVKVCKINVDEQPELAAQFNIMSIPTLVVLKKRQANSIVRWREVQKSHPFHGFQCLIATLIQPDNRTMQSWRLRTSSLYGNTIYRQSVLLKI